MLTEYLFQMNQGEAMWQDVMPGVRVCRFSLYGAGSVSLPLRLEPLHFETLFCQGGRLVLERTGERVLTVEEREILLLSDCASLCRVRVQGSLWGALVSVDARRARSCLKALCGLLGELKLDFGRVRERMARQEGCAVLSALPWSRAVFGDLDCLPEEERGRYSVFKAVELLYLLCTHDRLLKADGTAAGLGGYLARTVAEMRTYMEEHLEEKLTISELSRRFCISQTSFKTYFRQMYGCPVHSWLLERRMARAAELLRTSPASILQVAQAVGYEGASQFNLAFKRRYGMSPRQYVKMSDPGKS